MPEMGEAERRQFLLSGMRIAKVATVREPPPYAFVTIEGTASFTRKWAGHIGGRIVSDRSVMG